MLFLKFLDIQVVLSVLTVLDWSILQSIHHSGTCRFLSKEQKFCSYIHLLKNANVLVIEHIKQEDNLQL